MRVAFFLVIAFICLSQRKEQIIISASKLFEKEQYVDATPLYLKLLSLNPKNSDYNFRYGTCILHKSSEKSEAIRYLSFAVNDEKIDPRAFYFLGKALHYNYQFQSAKENYNKYLLNRIKKDKRYLVEREIEMCENGKKLLNQITDIIVTEKKEIDRNKFFRLYNDKDEIGGEVLVSEEFQSRLDKKKGHIPIVYFPSGAKEIYYSSYGNKDTSGKDIYIRRRLPDGSWGAPQKLPGDVNTDEDEDFPYMHPSGNYLYFSSRGHNSMGGYDIFRSEFNPSKNSFNQPENIDFAINSPSDDLFYVVDSSYENAYFASSRQSENGMLHVYNVRVNRIPIQEIIVMGDFLSEINPDNKSMQIKVTSDATGGEIGIIQSNNEGKFSFVFPKGGQYNYEVIIDGSNNIYNFSIELPYLDEFRLLKQRAIHSIVNGNETVNIVNLFNDKIEGEEAILAELIRKRSVLDVNVNQFDVAQLDVQKELNDILSDIGLKNMSLSDIRDELERLSISESSREETNSRARLNLKGIIQSNSEILSILDKDVNSLINQSDTDLNPAEQYDILMQSKRLNIEKNELAKDIQNINSIINELSQIKSNNSEVSAFKNQFNDLLLHDKGKEALELLRNNQKLIKEARNYSDKTLVDDLIAENIKLNNEIVALKSQKFEFENIKDDLRSDLNSIKNKYESAKKKEAERLKKLITEKEEEIEIVNNSIKDLEKKIDSKTIQADSLDKKIILFQKVMSNNDVAVIDEYKLKQSIQKAQQSLGEFDQLIEIKLTKSKENKEKYENLSSQNTNVDITTNTFGVNDYSVKEKEFISKYSDDIKDIESSNKTDIEKTELLKDLKLIQLKDIDEELNIVNNDLKNGIDNLSLISYEKFLSDLSAQVNAELSELNQMINALNNTSSIIESESDNTKEDTVQEIENIPVRNDDNIIDIESIVESDSLVLNLPPDTLEIENTLNKNTLNKELVESYKVQKQKILNNVDNKVDDYSYNESLLVLEVNQLDILESKKLSIQKKLNKNPENSELNIQMDFVNKLIDNQKVLVSSQRDKTIASISDLQIVSNNIDIDSNYSSASPEEIISREQELQEVLIQLFRENKEKLKRSYSVSVDLENVILERAISDSKKRMVELNQVPEDNENDVLEAQIELDIEKSKEVQSDLDSTNIKPIESESIVIEEILKESNNVKSLEKKKQLLQQAELRQEKLDSNIIELLQDQKINKIEEQNNVVLVSKEYLEGKRRKFTVRIGELSSEIIGKEEEINNAVKKDIPILEVKRTSLITEKSFLESQIENIDDRLLELNKNNVSSIISDKAKVLDISKEKEREISISENYNRYYEISKEAISLENEIKRVNSEIEKEQKQFNENFEDFSSDDNRIRLKVKSIKYKQDLNRKYTLDLIKYKTDAEKLLENSQDKLAIQNLALRGIKPLEIETITTELVNIPATGFSITRNKQSVYSEKNPIPIGVKHPSGLVYRVQVGAFAKPIPQDLFKEFNPVSGEKIGKTNITRYMVGFFNNSADVVKARTQIRSLGYSDAFVVAYCDGKRIRFGDARRMQAQGTCVSKSMNDIVFEVAKSTLDKSAISPTNSSNNVNQENKLTTATNSVNSSLKTEEDISDNSSKKPVAESNNGLKKELFFTVQVGVFNRPISIEDSFKIPDVFSIKLPNGQVRYASGIYSTIEECLPRRDEAIKFGIKGPFITAYLNGERISISKAKKILLEQGN